MKGRKNFLPTFLLAILFWLVFLYLVIFTSPEENFLILSFYFLLFLSLFLSLSLVFANSRRGFLVALGLTGMAFFQQIQLFNILNIILIVGILFLGELFFSHR